MFYAHPLLSVVYRESFCLRLKIHFFLNKESAKKANGHGTGGQHREEETSAREVTRKQSIDHHPVSAHPALTETDERH